MSVNVSITLKDGHLPADIAAVANVLDGPGRVDLNEAMGEEVRVLTFFHLSRLAESKHATADRLGGTRTGHIAAAAESIANADCVTVSEKSALLTIDHRGILSRAFGDVHIAPTGGRKALAIPLTGFFYGHSPREFGRDRFFVFVSRLSGNAFLAERQADKNARPLLAYLLVRSVTQKQDRSLLPSQEEWEEAAVKGATNAVTRVMRKMMGLN